MPGTGARAVSPGLRRMTQLHARHRSAYWNPSTPECDLKSVFSLSQFQMIRASCQTWGTCCNPSIKENDLALCQIQGIYYNPGLRIITISRTGTGRLKIQGKPGLRGKFWCTWAGEHNNEVSRSKNRNKNARPFQRTLWGKFIVRPNTMYKLIF